MLGHNAIGQTPLSDVVAGESIPYFIDIDDATEIDMVTLAILLPFIDPDAVT